MKCSIILVVVLLVYASSNVAMAASLLGNENKNYITGCVNYT